MSIDFRRILVVDDSPLIREAARLALHAVAGWEVLTAASGEEGLARAAVDQPDAILLDVVMPGIDGLETAERLRSDPATAAIPVLMLTASDLAPGTGDGAIAKPFEIPALAGIVASQLGWSS